MSKLDPIYSFARKHPFIASSIVASVIGLAKTAINGFVDVVCILRTGQPASGFTVYTDKVEEEEPEETEKNEEVEQETEEKNG